MCSFDKQKQDSLSRIDLSRKGSIDAPIQQLVQFINRQSGYFTTSSCSGRTIIVDNDEDGSIKKKGCQWLFTSHDPVDPASVLAALQGVDGNAVFKFEPFILHVQCRSLEEAQLLLSSGVASGFRNSGISVGNKRKFITAIRSTQSLEVPLSHDGRLLVNTEYVEYIVGLANKKMVENCSRMDRFFNNVQDAIDKHEVHGDEKKHATKIKKGPGESRSGDQTKKTSKESGELLVEDFSDCCLFQSEFVT